MPATKQAGKKGVAIQVNETVRWLVRVRRQVWLYMHNCCLAISKPFHSVSPSYFLWQLRSRRSWRFFAIQPTFIQRAEKFVTTWRVLGFPHLAAMCLKPWAPTAIFSWLVSATHLRAPRVGSIIDRRFWRLQTRTKTGVPLSPARSNSLTGEKP